MRLPVGTLVLGTKKWIALIRLHGLLPIPDTLKFLAAEESIGLVLVPVKTKFTSRLAGFARAIMLGEMLELFVGQDSSTAMSAYQGSHRRAFLRLRISPILVASFYVRKWHWFGSGLKQIELPPIVPYFVEHQSFQKKCPCGNTIIGSFPQGVTPGISYGASVNRLIAYFNVRHYLPFDRLKEIFTTVFGLAISTGTLVESVNRVAEKARPAYELIREKAIRSRTNGGDETGMIIDGQKGWFWTIQGKLFTFIIASFNRGAQTLNEHFPDGFAFSVLVHDCWKCYFKIAALAHQICLAHLLREFNHVYECYKLKWATDFKQLLVETIAFKKTLLPGDYHKTLSQRTVFEERLSALLQQSINPKHSIAVSLQKRLIKYKPHILTFLYFHEVPPDNNASERAIRNVKVKQKISGQFRSFEGAKNFAILRSVIDTAIKNNLNPLHSLSKIYAVPLYG